MKQLKKEILDKLVKKTKLSDNTIRKNISILKRDYPKCTSNAAAQIFARKHDTTVISKLDDEDRATLPNMEVKPEKISLKKTVSKKKKELILIEYDTANYFRKEHINEINKAYTNGCYTAAYILCRKVVENMIIDILRSKFPENVKNNKELYYDTRQRRFKDFSVILDNLYGKRAEFDIEKKVIERLVQKSKILKKDANDKTHSWFHIIKNKSELDSFNIQEIIELIKVIEQKL